MKKYKKDLSRVPEGIKKLKNEANIYIYEWRNNEEVSLALHEYDIMAKGVIFSKNLFSIGEIIHFYLSNMYLEIRKRDNGNNKTILNYDAVIKKNENIVLVATFDILKYRKLTNRLLNEKRIKTIYVMNGVGYLWASGFKFPENKKIYLVDNYYVGLEERDLSFNYFQENEILFEQTYGWLSDELSKQTMEQYLEGHIELTNFPLKRLWKQTDVNDQYFPSDIIQLEENEVFVDCGAYIGDTLKNFSSRVKNFKKYYALEPDRRRFSELNRVIKHLRRGGGIAYPGGSMG